LDQRRFDALVTICAAALGRPDAPAGRAGVRPTVYLYADVATWAGWPSTRSSSTATA